MNEFQFRVGQKVKNTLKGQASDKERFRFQGIIVSAFRNLEGECRYVVESSNGTLRIYSYFLEADND